MCDFGSQCAGGHCGPGPALVGCDLTSRCSNCAVGLMSVHDLPTQDAAGKWQMPAGAIQGYVIPSLGWVITDGGKSELQAGDVVMAIDGEPANVNYFHRHWFEMQQEKKPTQWDAVVYRPGERFLLTVALKPA
jgi:hypothetical protein